MTATPLSPEYLEFLQETFCHEERPPKRRRAPQAEEYDCVRCASPERLNATGPDGYALSCPNCCDTEERPPKRRRAGPTPEELAEMVRKVHAYIKPAHGGPPGSISLGYGVCCSDTRYTDLDYEPDAGSGDDDEVVPEFLQLLPEGSSTREAYEEDPADFWERTEAGRALAHAIRTNPTTLTSLCPCNKDSKQLEHYTTPLNNLPQGKHHSESYTTPVCDDCLHNNEECGVAGLETAQEFLESDCPACRAIGKGMHAKENH